jgi:hypothetical protein
VTTYTDDPDGFTLIEDRSFEPGAGLAFTSTGTLSGHPINVYRRRHPATTEGVDDLAVLELWYVAEVDRRLTAIGLPAVGYGADRARAENLHRAHREAARQRPSVIPPMFTSRHDPTLRPEYPRPHVRRIHTENGSHIEPPLPQPSTLEPLGSLRWHAAVVEIDAGIGETLEVHEARYWAAGIRQNGYYDVYTVADGHITGSIGPMTFGQAWSHLNGINQGARIRNLTDAMSRAEVSW